MSLTLALAFLTTLIAWVIETLIFDEARIRTRDNGVDATLGNANWLVLGALIALFIDVFVTACRIFTSYRGARSLGAKRSSPFGSLVLDRIGDAVLLIFSPSYPRIRL